MRVRNVIEHDFKSILVSIISKQFLTQISRVYMFMNTSFDILIALCFVNTYGLSFVHIPYQCTNILLEYLSYMSYVATSSVNTLTKWRLNKFMILDHKYN